MDERSTEIEAKFAVADLEPTRRCLLDLAARLARPRLRETNLRFDDDADRLRRAGHVLRLRQNHETRLTFKAPGRDAEHRQEIEFGVDEPRAARRFLEALGYRVVFVYEKYRETFALDAVDVMLDELPFGAFVEIEGPAIAAVRAAADRLGLPWEARLATTYLGLFERLRSAHGWSFRDATFDNFRHLPRPPLDEVLQAASR